MTTNIIDSTITSTGTFHLVRFVDGLAQAYVPYSSGCTNCCGSASETVAAPRSCCGG